MTDFSELHVSVKWRFRKKHWSTVSRSTQNYYSPPSQTLGFQAAENRPENHLQKYKVSHLEEYKTWLDRTIIHCHQKLKSSLLKGVVLCRALVFIALRSGCRRARTAAGTRAVCPAAPGCRCAGRRSASSSRRSGTLQSNDAPLCWRAWLPPVSTWATTTHLEHTPSHRIRTHTHHMQPTDTILRVLITHNWRICFLYLVQLCPCFNSIKTIMASIY